MEFCEALFEVLALLLSLKGDSKIEDPEAPLPPPPPAEPPEGLLNCFRINFEGSSQRMTSGEWLELLSTRQVTLCFSLFNFID